MTEFPARLKRLRQEKNLSQGELGEKAGIHYTHISKYERGESAPSLETLVPLAKALSVSLDYLILGNETDAAVANMSDKELLSMFEQAEKLPADDKKAMKKFLNAFLVTERFKSEVIS